MTFVARHILDVDHRPVSTQLTFQFSRKGNRDFVTIFSKLHITRNVHTSSFGASYVFTSSENIIETFGYSPMSPPYAHPTSENIYY